MSKIEIIKEYLKEGVNEAEIESKLENLVSIDDNFLDEQYRSNNKTVRSWADRKVTSGIETFKTNSMSVLIEDQVKTRLDKHKNESAAETQLRLINERLDKAETDRKREAHINSALKYASEKGIPGKYVDKFLGTDFDETQRYLDEFAKDFDIQVNEEVDERFKEHGRNVNYKQKGQPEKTSFTDDEVAHMSSEDFKKNFSKIFKK